MKSVSTNVSQLEHINQIRWMCFDQFASDFDDHSTEFDDHYAEFDDNSTEFDDH